MLGKRSPGLPGSAFGSALGFSSSLGLWQQLQAPVRPRGSARGAGAAGGAGAADAALSRHSLSSRWLERSLPVYGSQAAAVLEPLWAKSVEVALYASEQCSSLLSWIHDSLPCFIEWVRRVPQLLEETRNAGVATARGGL